MVNFLNRSSATLFIAALALLTGCAGVAVEPFQAFAESTRQLHQGTDTALATIDEMSEDRFMREALEQTGASKTGKVLALRITTTEADPLAWSEESLPLFLQVERFRDGARQTTAAVVSYAELLVRLASPELLSIETFDQLTEELNANAFDALSAISGSSPGEEQVALFSTLASEAARQYLETRRKAALEDALTTNQETIQHFTAQMQGGVKIAASISVQEYDERFQELALKMTTSSGPASESTRRAALESLIALDRKHIQQLNTLKSLYQAFGRIPNAHTELVKSMSDPGLSLTAIPALADSGRRLETNFDQAVASNKVKAIQAIADKAIAQATVLEAEAGAAELRASVAEADAVRARAELDADPNNVQKMKLADGLEARAMELAELAKAKRARAVEARLAADAAQQKANQMTRKILEADS